MSIDFQAPVIETERLRLRLPRASDLPAHTAFRTSERSKGVGGPYPASASFDHLCGIIGHWQLRGYGRWMVADKTTDAPYGIVGLFYPEDWPEPEVAWSLYDNAEGKGIAFEAASAARDYAYQTLGWDRVISMIMKGNTRSIRLAERLGCVNERAFEHPSYGSMDVWVHTPPAPERSHNEQ